MHPLAFDAPKNHRRLGIFSIESRRKFYEESTPKEIHGNIVGRMVINFLPPFGPNDAGTDVILSRGTSTVWQPFFLESRETRVEKEIGIIHGRTKLAEGVLDWTKREGPFQMSASGWSLPARAETRGPRLPLALLSPSLRWGEYFLLRAHRN